MLYRFLSPTITRNSRAASQRFVPRDGRSPNRARCSCKHDIGHDWAHCFNHIFSYFFNRSGSSLIRLSMVFMISTNSSPSQEDGLERS